MVLLPRDELKPLRRQFFHSHTHSSAREETASSGGPASRRRSTLCIIKDTFPKRLLAHYSETTVTCLHTQNVHFTSEERAQVALPCREQAHGVTLTPRGILNRYYVERRGKKTKNLQTEVGGFGTFATVLIS